MGIIEKIFGTHSEHELKRIYPIVDHIDALEPEMQKLSDEELKEKTKEFKERLAKGETPVSYTHLDVYKRQRSHRSGWIPDYYVP